MWCFWGVVQEIVSLLFVWNNIDVDIDTVLFTGKESNDDMPGPMKFKTYLQSWMDVRLPSSMFRNFPLIISIPLVSMINLGVFRSYSESVASIALRSACMATCSTKTTWWKSSQWICRTHVENEPTLKLKVMCWPATVIKLWLGSNWCRVFSLHCRLLNQIYTYLEYLVLEGLGPLQHLWQRCMLDIFGHTRGQIQCRHAECW